ncbi:hypothetical protein [Tessaracoccus coleopterorum]|nr:hypothetical protein [Tessaracoccus coleopterorum]
MEQEIGDTDLAGIGWRADDSVYVSGYDLLYPTTGPAVAALLDGYSPPRC